MVRRGAADYRTVTWRIAHGIDWLTLCAAPRYSGELVIPPRFAEVPLAAGSWKNAGVKISFHLGRLLAILVIAGLVFAPLSRPASAGMAKDMTMGGPMPEMAADATAEMAADMPCCPDKSVPMDCDQCPLMALCMVQTFHEPSSTGVVEVRPVTMRRLAPGSDPVADSLGQHPPPRPPRSLVRSA